MIEFSDFHRYGDRMRISRQYRGMKQSEAASMIGVDAPTYSRWESSKHYPIKAYREKISIVLQMREEVLFPDETDTDINRG